MNQPSDQWPQWGQHGQQPQWYPPAGGQSGHPGHPGHYGPPSQPPPAQPGGFQSTYGGFGAFTGEPPKRKPSKKPLLIGGIAVIALAGGAGAAWLLGAFRGDVLDQTSVQQGVVKVLTEHYGEHDAKDAQCPSDQEITTGHEFTCSVRIAGKSKIVRIRVLNTKPEFEVGAPR